jgi:ATP-dependent DNA ligase
LLVFQHNLLEGLRFFCESPDHRCLRHLLLSGSSPRAGWVHEVKHDGYRTQLIIERGKAPGYTRNGFDWTDRYPAITKAAAKLDCRSAIVDGEVIIQNERGGSDFEALKSAIRWQPQRLILCVFDLLHLNGKDLRELSLVERRSG